ncbi:MAG TPA: DUF4249 domain-containing protein [Chryseosolibacter sp.]|nr:DUF4249 domain-containing protein [Chryseosolibacter sp.]
MLLLRPGNWVTVLLLPAMLLLGSCLPDPLEVHSVPQAKEELVVSSQIIPDQSLLVLLTRTFGALEASNDSDPEALLDYIAVNDAVVTLEGPAGLDTLELLGNGVYSATFIPFKAGDTYHLKINSLEFGEAFATAAVSSEVDFQNVEADLFYNGYNDTLAQITYTLNDPSEQNWYMINVQEVEQEDFVENLLNPRAFTVLLSDSEFNGQNYGERFRVFPRDYEPGDTIAVSLANISEEYYRFMKLRIDNRFSLVEFISEPVNYPSNVVGGKGYFNLYVPDVRFFVLE